ncbi:envelope glycoprotein [Thalictrum thalictroides]|uniref:Envelope glycoprotein n=1 Tax=Thalictrum thalictroides TaxID=46969 RepID=A0A7J6USR6_THATH|nr:envelope glycoprotein [Thalictrum thalictroides]
MASLLCRSAARSASKTLVSKTLPPKSMPSFFASPTTKKSPSVFRMAMALGCVESLMPLHSAIASARLKSIIAADSSCWSWLSQGLVLTL